MGNFDDTISEADRMLHPKQYMWPDRYGGVS